MREKVANLCDTWGYPLFLFGMGLMIGKAPPIIPVIVFVVAGVAMTVGVTSKKAGGEDGE